LIRFEHSGVEREAAAAEIFNALGRKPRVEGLGLPEAGVAIEGGRIAANACQQTSQPHVFAAGDCTGPLEVVHVAVQQGEIAARNAARLIRGDAGLESTASRLKLFVVFTEPQVAAVGLSEAEAAAAGIPFAAAKHPFDDHGKSLVMGETEGFVKLMADLRTGEIIGGSVAGPHAGELIHEVVVAMRFHSTAAQFASVPHYHPTLSEIWTYPAEELAARLETNLDTNEKPPRQE
jgi:pyruvate/2-oxoglutarate dehydrogenase complex dihydrolipoamide dehydrogenase (E3) component